MLRGFTNTGDGKAIQNLLCGKPADSEHQPPTFFKSAKAGLLGIIRGRNVWSPEEDRILAQNYPVSGVDGCVQLLPGRSAQAIAVRACKKQLTSSYNSGGNRAPWTDLENEIVAKHSSPTSAITELARAGFTRSYAAVSQRMNKYGSS